MLKGTIVRFVADKAFGFINVDGDSPDYFFHIDDCNFGKSKIVPNRTQVEFEPIQGPKGIRAESVRLAD